jgi:hypothetical protein
LESKRYTIGGQEGPLLKGAVPLKWKKLLVIFNGMEAVPMQLENPNPGTDPNRLFSIFTWPSKKDNWAFPV